MASEDVYDVNAAELPRQLKEHINHKEEAVNAQQYSPQGPKDHVRNGNRKSSLPYLHHIYAIS